MLPAHSDDVSYLMLSVHAGSYSDTRRRAPYYDNRRRAPYSDNRRRAPVGGPGLVTCGALTLRPAFSYECPADGDIGNCNAAGLSVGSLCEADGECGTSELDNCGYGYDIYMVASNFGNCAS